MNQELTDEQIDLRLAKLRGDSDLNQRSGGAHASTAWILLVFSAIASVASLGLIMSEKSKLEDPKSALVCDVNPLIGCGKWVGTWQNEVFFGISNSVIGLAFFAALTALSIALLTGSKLHRNIWIVLSISMVAGMIWVLWFMYQSLVIARSLCPFCMVIWLCMIPLSITIWGRSAQAGHLSNQLVPLGKAIVRNRFVIASIVYAVLFTLLAVWFWQDWQLLF
ncbi:vitamin K epoxide reductase family protein [Arcanobacterium ihumii]|uniref:vitamin K epoxide reductase family protein n=1 Tax=Arcanobacterium ihumii TaxID=2138162 RepID=UPI000F541DCA|nr:vitamin K epoxide reductase family protein [Arcanobacterium ihumii]